MSAKIELTEKKKISKLNKKEKDDWSYFYYGTFTSQLYPNKTPKEIRILYNNKESQIFLDSIGDFNFWESSWWNSYGFRKNKIYIVFDGQYIDWSKAKLIELNLAKPMTHEEVCKMLKENASQNYNMLCNQIKIQ